jgi:hypothetical protein
MIRPLLLSSLALLALLSASVTTASAAVNCSAFPSQAAAQAAYRADPLGLANLDRDRDGIACEANPAPFDRTPVDLAGVSTASAARTAPAAPLTGDGASESSRAVNGTALGLSAALLLGLVAVAGVSVRRSGH